mmetsp:Transcript_44648/g.123748  ORF Transcript_44648/g.123748 Transcript_44648/m.123748 type:complete len:238 (+) Transcript_44648:274-987(+)
MRGLRRPLEHAPQHAGAELTVMGPVLRTRRASLFPWPPTWRILPGFPRHRWPLFRVRRLRLCFVSSSRCRSRCGFGLLLRSGGIVLVLPPASRPFSGRLSHHGLILFSRVFLVGIAGLRLWRVWPLVHMHLGSGLRRRRLPHLRLLESGRGSAAIFHLVLACAAPHGTPTHSHDSNAEAHNPERRAGVLKDLRRGAMRGRFSLWHLPASRQWHLVIVQPAISNVRLLIHSVFAHVRG